MRLFFWKKKKKTPPLPSPDAPADVEWHKDERGYYRRLLPLRGRDLGLRGTGGVFAVWNRGLHPKWIYVGATDDLALSLDEARDNTKILAFETHGGVYVTWAPFRVEYRDGAAAYLREQLSPEMTESLPTDRPVIETEPVPVRPPR